MRSRNRALGISVLLTLLATSGCGGSGEPETAAVLRVLPAAVGQAKDLRTATTPVEAKFTPASKGSPVVIQEKTGGSWKDVAAGQQSVEGSFVAQVDAGRAGRREFRARTTPHGQDVVTTGAVAQRPMQKVWADEFDGSQLDPGKWRTREQPPAGRRLCAVPDADRARVDKGSLVLSVKRVRTTKACPHGFWHNGMVGTGEVTTPGFQTTYGIFAARVRFQRGQGMHGSFWMQGPPGTGTEIDVAEYFGDGRPDGGLSNFVHHTSKDGTLESAGGIQKGIRPLLGKKKSLASGWHVYSVEWSPKGYVFRFDGVQTFRTDKPYVATAKEFLVLSLLTSDYELPRLKDPSSTMRVDWVRAWND